MSVISECDLRFYELIIYVLHPLTLFNNLNNVIHLSHFTVTTVLYITLLYYNQAIENTRKQRIALRPRHARWHDCSHFWVFFLADAVAGLWFFVNRTGWKVFSLASSASSAALR